MNANVVKLPREREGLEGPRVGPAEVTRCGPGRVAIAFPDGASLEAVVALAHDYEPAVGDTVLAIRQDDEAWIIGVIHGRGPRRLHAVGDLELAAGGKLRLRAEGGVEIDGPRLDVKVGVLSTLARRATERFETLRQHVVELLSVQAGQSETTVDGACVTRAESATILTKEKVNINGKAIHLG
jgi:hypothetical protein